MKLLKSNCNLKILECDLLHVLHDLKRLKNAFRRTRSKCSIETQQPQNKRYLELT